MADHSTSSEALLPLPWRRVALVVALVVLSAALLQGVWQAALPLALIVLVALGYRPRWLVRDDG